MVICCYYLLADQRWKQQHVYHGYKWHIVRQVIDYESQTKFEYTGRGVDDNNASDEGTFL